MYIAEDTKKRDWMSEEEQKLKRKLLKLLIDDGQGHKHPKYAKCLSLLDIKIVPLDEDPEFTAAISFDEGVIYIGEGFLTDPSTFSQLNVLMRHELCHNLLMHQIRMMRKIKTKFGDEAYAHMVDSASLHRLNNIIEDDEISNTRYTEEDKKIVRNMFLNGQLIGGLITEDHRKDWIHLTVEDMYEKLLVEMQLVKNTLQNAPWAFKHNDFISREIANVLFYTDKTSPSTIKMPIDVYITKSKEFKKLQKNYQDLIKNLYEKIQDENIMYTNTDLEKMMSDIADSAPTEQVDLSWYIDHNTGELHKGNSDLIVYTPEEKYLAMQVLKNIMGNTDFTKKKLTVKRAKHSPDYIKKYNEIIKKLDNKDVTTADLYKLLQGISGENSDEDAEDLLNQVQSKAAGITGKANQEDNK